MGCDIHTFAEVRINGKWEKVVGELFPAESWSTKKWTDEPFGWRSYSMFAFFAGVRNYDHCTPISEPKGLPPDSEYLNTETEPHWFNGAKCTNKQEIEAD